jgi:hypothetical protein
MFFYLIRHYNDFTNCSQLPVLIIILGLMLRSTIPDAWRILVQGYDAMQTHLQPADRIVEAI